MDVLFVDAWEDFLQTGHILDVELMRRDIAQNDFDPFYLLSGKIGRKTERNNFKLHLGQMLLRGDSDHLQTNICKINDRWKISKEARQKNSIPVNIIDKIKVYSCFFSAFGTSKIFLKQSAFQTQIKTAKAIVYIFLQDVVKCGDTKATLTRYKIHEKSHQDITRNKNLCVINVNIPRDKLDLLVTCKTLAAWYKLQEPLNHLNLTHIKRNNNSCTVNGFFSGVKSEDLRLKTILLQKKIILHKKSFRTFKYVTEYPVPSSRLALLFADPCDPLMTYSTCPCLQCSCLEFAKTEKETEKTRQEIQIHNRCLNCSSVSAVDLLPVVCDMINKFFAGREQFLNFPLVRHISALEAQSGNLVPPHIKIFLEEICSDAAFASNIIKLNRNNFACSGSFSQLNLAGDKLTVTPDSSIINNKRNKFLFSKKRKSGKGDKTEFRGKKKCLDTN